MSDRPLVEIQNVVKRYGDKTAVKGLTLDIKPGEVLAFLGPNGAGKTTTMKMVAGLLRPSSGVVTVAGHNVVDAPVEAKRHMAYVPDEPYLYDKLTGREFLHFVAGLYGLTGDVVDERIEQLAQKFDFASYMDELCEGYSHGMSQRVVVASALIHEPDVLLIDEPFVGLDPRSSRTLKDTFTELAERGASVFLSTHTLTIADEVADRICIFRHGEIVSLGTHEEIGSKDRDLEEVFLELTEGEKQEAEAK